ncbi:winged helix-turn-helix domain-containing protein [Methanogenium organophilum]|uniref:Winged helix-turn-helix domain-containing protein n=1 Tax=Methanogenium organophilum TaxID=2199 RepID=A0A9X9S3H6_METOG|nr:winged helix-turn-helix domain-containing protein [Methanogenium organophilum]WAI00823.1 winged helix-turn-helix domain-containing protein [Methanogenium organophilum]
MPAVNSVNKVRLPPSSQRVLTLLKDGEPRTFKQVTQEIEISPRTVRYAIKKLKENGLIIEKFNFRDARQVLYQTKDVLSSDEAPKATA